MSNRALVTVPAISATMPVPMLAAAAGERAGMRFLEFFAHNIRNPHTRRAYYRAAEEFLGWCASVGVPSIVDVRPLHVSTWIEAATCELAAPSVKQRLAAIRHLFDWLVTGQVVPVNPAGSVRGPRHVVTTGQTPVLDPAEARTLLDSIGVPSILIQAQRRLGVTPLQMNILLQLLDYFYDPTRHPFPRKTEIAKRMGVSAKTIQINMRALEQAGLIQREIRKKAAGDYDSNIYHLDGLIARVQDLEPEFRAAKEERQRAKRRVEMPRGRRE
jgi:DnaD-like protein/integrase family protein with SAM-like domain